MCRWFRYEVCSSDNTFPHDLESLHKCREAGMKRLFCTKNAVIKFLGFGPLTGRFSDLLMPLTPYKHLIKQLNIISCSNNNFLSIKIDQKSF